MDNYKPTYCRKLHFLWQILFLEIFVMLHAAQICKPFYIITLFKITIQLHYLSKISRGQILEQCAQFIAPYCYESVSGLMNSPHP